MKLTIRIFTTFLIAAGSASALGLNSSSVAQQLQFLLNGVPVTSVREDICTVQVIARSSGETRIATSQLENFTLAGAHGERIPLSQVGNIEIRQEEPIIRAEIGCQRLRYAVILPKAYNRQTYRMLLLCIYNLLYKHCLAAITLWKPVLWRSPVRPA